MPISKEKANKILKALRPLNSKIVEDGDIGPKARETFRKLVVLGNGDFTDWKRLQGALVATKFISRERVSKELEHDRVSYEAVKEGIINVLTTP